MSAYKQVALNMITVSQLLHQQPAINGQHGCLAAAVAGICCHIL